MRAQDGSDGEADAGPGPGGGARDISMLRSCRSVEDFQRINRISEGTYGVVYRCALASAGVFQEDFDHMMVHQCALSV